MGFRLPKTKGMLRREAADWLARRHGGRDPDVERKFQQWLADPRHAAAFDRVTRSYEQAGLLRHSPIAMSTARERAPGKREWKPLPALAAAAAIVILVPIGLVAYRERSLPFVGTDALMLMTQVGEIRQVELPDGSKVTLDTATKIDMEMGRSRRSAHLRYGRARFHIAQASTPFVVETASTTITARDGVIDVEQIDGHGRVQVIAGAADVGGPGQNETSLMAVRAGEAVTVNAEGTAQRDVVTRAPDWTKGMLQFDGTPLAEAVALANRYSERHIVLAGDLNGLRVTGAFRAGDTPGLAKALAAAFSLSLQQGPDGSFLLRRSEPSGPPNKKRG